MKKGDLIFWFQSVGYAKWKKHAATFLEATPKGARIELLLNGVLVRRTVQQENIERRPQ